MRKSPLTILVVLTAVCVWLTAAKLHISSDLSVLFPESGDAGALARLAALVTPEGMRRRSR